MITVTLPYNGVSTDAIEEMDITTLPFSNQLWNLQVEYNYMTFPNFT